MKHNAAYWVSRLQLNAHIEGGYYREIYRSALSIKKENLPGTFHGDRSASTSIYFLLERGKFSAFHRIASDEVWHFYAGDCLLIYELMQDGSIKEHRLGNNPENGESFQLVIKGGNWFASKVSDEGEYALAGCTVAPGFDFADFEMAARSTLLKQYPQHTDIIISLTR